MAQTSSSRFWAGQAGIAVLRMPCLMVANRTSGGQPSTRRWSFGGGGVSSSSSPRSGRSGLAWQLRTEAIVVRWRLGGSSRDRRGRHLDAGGLPKSAPLTAAGLNHASLRRDADEDDERKDAGGEPAVRSASWRGPDAGRGQSARGRRRDR